MNIHVLHVISESHLILQILLQIPSYLPHNPSASHAGLTLTRGSRVAAFPGTACALNRAPSQGGHAEVKPIQLPLPQTFFACLTTFPVQDAVLSLEGIIELGAHQGLTDRIYQPT